MHPVIQSAVAAQHVKDMLDQAADQNRARDARRTGQAAAGGATRAGRPVPRHPPRPGACPLRAE